MNSILVYVPDIRLMMILHWGDSETVRLAILIMLKGVGGNFAAHFGIKCSSFCKVNVGTSMRSACTAMGFTDYESVFSSNKLLERIPRINVEM